MKVSPDSEAALYDYLNKYFGLGDYDDLASTIPFWRHRLTEITKLKASRRARSVAIEQLWIAAEYARANHLVIRHFTWLYRYIPEATAWHRARTQAALEREFEDLYDSAISIEYEREDSSWLERLTRAQGDARQQVYVEWLEQQ